MDNQQPSPSDQEWWDKISFGYVGLDKPKVAHSAEQPDPYSYKRRKAADKLGVTEDLLNDEPDNDAGSPEQAYA